MVAGAQDKGFDEKCIFCKIVRGGDLLYSDEELSCFRDIKPGAPHHYLVVPTKHVGNCKTLGKDHVPMVERMVETGKEILRKNNFTNLGDVRKHYVCGSLAAITNTVVTFPIHKVQFRQQLHGVVTMEAVRQLQRDGLRNLYRGLLPPLLHKTSRGAAMFGLYEDFSRTLLDRTAGSGIPELATRSCAAALAGTLGCVLTPFERVQTLLQDHRHHVRFNNTAQTFWTLLTEYGVGECYRGLVPVLLRTGPSSVLFFAFRGPVKEQLPKATSQTGHFVNDFVCGGVLGAFLGIMFYPVNVVKSRAQSQVGGAFQPFSQVLKTVWRERGSSVVKLFRGAHLNFHRTLLSWGIFNATYELLLKLM